MTASLLFATSSNSWVDSHGGSIHDPFTQLFEIWRYELPPTVVVQLQLVPGSTVDSFFSGIFDNNVKPDWKLCKQIAISNATIVQKLLVTLTPFPGETQVPCHPSRKDHEIAKFSLSHGLTGEFSISFRMPEKRLTPAS